jgi:large-conductance mechanosensitive channel
MDVLSFDYGFGIFSLLFGLLYFGIIALSIFLMISTIRFFKRKTQNDQELLVKLDSVIKLLSQKNGNSTTE